MRRGRFSRELMITAALILIFPASCMPFKKPGTLEVDQARIKSGRFIVAGDYKSALEVYEAVCRTYSGQEEFFGFYRKTVEFIRLAADEAFDREDFALSGRAYYTLLDNKSYCLRLLQPQAAEKDLRERLDQSRISLSQRALAEYRKGELAKAISIWREIAVFDPDNAGIMNAIDRASLQLKNLRQQ